MSALFAETSPVLMAVAVILIFAGLLGTVALGRAVKKQAQAQGGAGTSSGGYYLKITLILIVGLACLFSGLFLLTSYRLMASHGAVWKGAQLPCKGLLGRS